MKLKSLLLLCLVLQNYGFSQIGAYHNETSEQKVNRMQWYTDAKFGMFIHWGAYSVLDGEYKGEKQKGALGEHIMQNLHIPIDDYKKDVVGNFNPTKFNAEQWVKYAYDTGMKYIVMTTKHHDGFALFKFKMKARGVNRKTKEPFSQRPALFDAKKNPINPSSCNIWGGSKMKIAYFLRPYYSPAFRLYRLKELYRGNF